MIYLYKDGDFLVCYVKLPEGTLRYQTYRYAWDEFIPYHGAAFLRGFPKDPPSCSNIAAAPEPVLCNQTRIYPLVNYCSYRKSPCLAKLIISMVISIAMLTYQRVYMLNL